MTAYNNKKILLLYEFEHPSLIELYENLGNHNFQTALFNVVKWKYRAKKNRGKGLLKICENLMKIPKLRGIINIFLRDLFLYRLAQRFDIVDFHYLSPFYYNLIRKLHKSAVSIKITIWGSDFYRSGTEYQKQREIYAMAGVIQIETPKIKDDFLAVFPEYEKKIRLAHFGITQFDIIDRVLNDDKPLQGKTELNLPTGKAVITCGTNGSPGHQHLLLLEHIEKLHIEIKEKISLIIPMTYGGTKEYIGEVKDKLDHLGLPFMILSDYLSVEDLARLRIMTDILITIQKTDALSAAIQEHLYAGGILLAGDWLPYDILKSHGIEYLTSSIDHLEENVTSAVLNLNDLKKRASDNRVRLRKLSSWDYAVKEWLDVYNDMA